MEVGSDTELVDAALRRDEAAYVRLFRRHAPRVMRVLRVGFHLSSAEAEDVMQDSFIRAFRSLGQLRHPERFGLWVQVIARREALASIHTRTQLRQTDLAIAAEASAVVEQVGAEPHAIKLVHTLLSELEEGLERTIVYRFYVDGDCTAQQLADELGLAKGTVTSRLTRFRARIKRRLMALVVAAEAEPMKQGGR